MEQMTNESLSPSMIFREAFRRHGAGLAIVTLLKPDGSPTGFTATSVASLSAAPPLATFNMSQTASSWSSMKPGAGVLIHFLASDSLELAQTMAGEASARFAGDHWAPGPDGLPLLRGVSAWLHCEIVSTLEVEFAATVAVKIVGGDLEEAGRDPMVYFQRAHGRAVAL